MKFGHYPPDDKLMVVLDVMIKKHVCRLPVGEDQRIVSFVYISDLFNNLLERIGD